MNRRQAALWAEFNDRRLVQWQSGAPGGEFARRLGVEWALTAVPSPRYNNVMTARFRPSAARAGIKAVVAELAKRRPSFGWVVGPSTQPAQLGRELTRAGLTHHTDVTAMALDLRKAAFPAPPPELRIECIGRPGGILGWAQTSARAFGEPLAEAAPIAKLERALGLSLGCRRQLFLGSVRGVPVATSMVFAARPTAGLYNVGVPKRYRGRGYGTALTAAALAEGKRHGCKIATLYATKVGIPLYRSLGFSEVGVTGIWVWKGNSEGGVKAPAPSSRTARPSASARRPPGRAAAAERNQ